MEQALAKKDILLRLQKEIAGLQQPSGQGINMGLDAVEKAFPGRVFPTGAVHEFISHAPQDGAATNGFITGVLSRLLQRGGFCLWVGTQRNLYPPALKSFGIAPEKIIFIEVRRQKELLWAVEEGLRCEGLAAVVGELQDLDFIQSRKLQLAVEQSRVTGFIHRFRPQSENAVACVARWKIKPLASLVEEGLPGVGHPRWAVELLRVRNGKPGSWQVEWSGGCFQVARPALHTPELQIRKIG